jgi:cell division protein ZapA (FtsZ GTPase activity inhibitor)
VSERIVPERTVPSNVGALSERPLPSEPNWYDISIAGKKFTIASRHGEAHIREVEKLLASTYDEVMARAQGQSALHTALLTALNLADELVNTRQALRDQYGQRIEGLLSRLSSALDSASAGPVQ